MRSSLDIALKESCRPTSHVLRTELDLFVIGGLERISKVFDSLIGGDSIYCRILYSYCFLFRYIWLLCDTDERILWNKQIIVLVYLHYIS